ncbi:ribosome biogenesis protein Nop53/GLTSCR2 [Crucibulum laeve]|uniref:Ribosome biogenesis protein NOP53 n=1 Tax=Crucibulum laeve TaxID=68775 RepID=A0A5C3LHZ0_9AGAR|nr:ribosome biogenesis protein Nop53/GLTSCR2 [Crucibulum laeve]
MTSKLSSLNVEKSKKSKSSIGAPSQHTQTGRKGKKAWRKNVNIEDVEAGLEEMRAEERVTGKTLQKTQDNELFAIDVTGDEQIRNKLPRYSKTLLSSTRILAERSAVPAVFSRPSTATKRKAALSYEEKDRLRKIAKRPRKGPFNAVMHPTEFAAGSAVIELSEAVKASGTYDAWDEDEETEDEDIELGMDTVRKRKIKPPTHQHPKSRIEIPAIVAPHQGASYNPPAEAHQELLMQAAEIEIQRLKDQEKLAEVKKKIEAGALRVVADQDESMAPGMTLDAADADEEEEVAEPDEQGIPKKKATVRKTKAQKHKAAKQLAEKRALADRAARKRLLASIPGAKTFRKTNSQIMSAREKEQEQRRLTLEEKLKKKGLAGQRLGRHKVPEGEVEVQLGEDLAESLRGLKPEGNLFRDRFLSMQQRALIEPRVPVLPKKRRNRIIEYEKHAWKNFK